MHSNGTADSAPIDDLVIEHLPSGEAAWLRPTTQTPRFTLEACRLNPERAVISADSDEGPRYVLTEKGRRDLALALLFDKGPSVAEVLLLQQAHRFACRCSASGAGGPCPFSGVSALALQDHYRDVHHWSVRLCPVCGLRQTEPSCSARDHRGVD